MKTKLLLCALVISALTSLSWAAAPAVPTAIVITPGNNSLSVVFTAPAVPTPVISTYEYSTDGGTSWRTRTDAGTTTSPISITTISGAANTTLVNGTSYSVRIRANNGTAGTATTAIASTPLWGDGTVGSPYKISNVTQWSALRAAITAANVAGWPCVELSNDISLLSLSNNNFALGASAFKGVFDGKGFKISNANIGTVGTPTLTNAASIFNFINGATIKNLEVTVAFYAGDPAKYCTGSGLVGSADGTCNIQNCKVNGIVNITNTGANATTKTNVARVGGIVGNCNATGVLTIINCNTNLDLKAISTSTNDFGTSTCGGILGEYTSGAKIYIINSSVSGSVYALSNNNAPTVGGIVGTRGSASADFQIINCLAANTVEGYNTSTSATTGCFVGGLIGNMTQNNASAIVKNNIALNPSLKSITYFTTAPTLNRISPKTANAVFTDNYAKSDITLTANYQSTNGTDGTAVNIAPANSTTDGNGGNLNSTPATDAISKLGAYVTANPKFPAITGTDLNSRSTLTLEASSIGYTGSSQAATVNNSVAGTVSNIKYDGSATAPTNSGSYTVTADFVPTSAANFNSLASGVVGTYTITKATPTLSLSVSSVTYNGSAQAATVNGSVTGSASNVLYNGSATVPTNAGSYPITADFVPTDGTNYASLTAASAGTLSINATVPGTPTSVVGTAGNTEVSVAFTAPANNGGSTITGYTVTPYDGATAGTPVTQNANPITVTGLTNGTAYTFKVTANNSVGSSLVSDASSAVTPIAPNVSVANNETKTPTDLGLTAASIVTVDNGGTLKIDATTEVSTVTIASGGKLNVEAGKPLTLATLTLKAVKDATTFSAKLDAAITATTVRLIKTIDDTKWYFMAFPCAVNVDDITGTPALGTLGDDWFIKYYDGNKRSNDGTGAGISNWVSVTNGATLTAKRGYIFGLKTGKPETELLIPLKTSILAAEEISTVPVLSYSTGSTSGTSHKGWNLVGQPFLSKYDANTNASRPNYMLMPSIDGTTFITTSKLLNTLPVVNPFAAYFVQAGSDGSISFELTSRQSARTLVSTNVSENVQLNVSTATGVDDTYLIMDNDQTTDYQIGQDFEKWIGTGTSKPQIYTSLGGINYAFNALPMNSVNNLPIGIYNKNAGRTTLSVNATKAPSLSKLLLLDKTTGITTDLLTSNYSFDATAGTDNTRFVITAQRVATNNLISSKLDESQLIVNDSKLVFTNLNADATVRVYDALGRIVANKAVKSNNLEIKLGVKGLYSIQVQSGTKIWTKKVVL